MRDLTTFQGSVWAVFLVCLGAAGLRGEEGRKTPPPEVVDLLNKYVQASAWSNRVSLSVHGRFDQTQTDFQGNIIYTRWGEKLLVFQRQGTKALWRGKRSWGASRGPGANPGSEESLWLIDGGRWFRMRNRYGWWNGSVTRQGRPPKDPNAIVCVDDYGGFCYGYGTFAGDQSLHLGQFLRDCPDVHIAGEEVVDGTRCQRVEAKTAYGVFIVWIAPEKGYNALRMRQVVEDPADRWGDESLAESALQSFFYETGPLTFREDHGVFLPVSGQAHTKFVIKEQYKGQRPDHHIRESTMTVRYDRIDLNPDFAALGAFRLAVPDGSKVQDMDHPGIVYEVIDGKLQGYVDANTVGSIETEIDKLAPAGGDGDPNEAHPVGTADRTTAPGADVSAPPRESGKTQRGWGGPLLTGAILVGLVGTGVGVALHRRRAE